MRNLLRPLAAALGFVLSTIGATAQTPPPIRIMPLGDSITDGSSFDSPDGSGGYRNRLYNLLTGAGYNVDYVGTQTINSGLLVEKEHEGHSGWQIGQLDTNMTAWLGAIADPDVVLMHIGTNDFGGNNATATAIDRLDALILKIATQRPYAHIIVTNLMERGEPTNTNIQNQFNPFVQDRVIAHAAAGRRVTFLDMRSAVPLSDMPDNLHPNQSGYDKMADAWFSAVTAIIGPNGDTAAPAIARARGGTDRTSVQITFSKPVADSAANAANYSLSGGLTISAAALDATKRVVTLTTSQQALSTTYTVTVNNIADRIAPTPSTIAPNSTVTFSGAIPRGYLNNVPESGGYTLAASLEVPAIANYLTANPVYSIDNRIGIGPFTRIAYYVELQSAAGDLQYLWTSMDAFTNDVNKIAVPTVSTGAIFQQGVTNLNVATNVPGITTGNGLAGNIEFWPTNYSAPNGLPVQGASDTVYDFGDTRTPGTYGSMQVHNTTAGQTLFAFNNWGGSTTGTNADLGIGNSSGANPDWTFANNAGSYSIKTIQVLVQTSGDFTGPTPVSATATFGRTSVKVSFSEPLAAASVKAESFTLSNGVIVLGATLAANQRDVILTTTIQPAGTPLTLTINNVRDTSPNSNKIAPNTSIPVGAASLPAEIIANVGAAANGYQLVYSLDLPATGNLNALGASAYSVNDAGAVDPYARVAYYLELQKPGSSPEFAWVSMDAFNTNRSRIGVPTVGSGAFFQRPVTNLQVISNSPAVTNGNIASGNIEFWPSNYNQVKAATSPAAASDAIFDFGDGGANTAAGYGSMQVHNTDAAETIFAFNHFGTDGVPLEFGIGNNPSASAGSTGGQKDWTFTNNATSYTRRVLHVLVLPGQSTPASVTSRIPEAANYQLVQQVAIPAAGTLNNTAATTYLVDNRGELGAFTRIGYLMELRKPGDVTTSFVWSSMDAFTTDGLKIGVPTTASGAIFQQIVTNMNVRSNVPGIVEGTGIATGNIEFWPMDYSAPNAIGIPNANAGTFDFGDTRSAGGSHGSMQIHNHGVGATQTLFSITNWGNAGSTTNAFGMGIGNQPTGSPDWTFAANSGTYDVRSLQVYVLPQPIETIAPTITRIVPSTGLKGLLVTFSETIADSAANVANFAINNGVTVTNATLLAGNREMLLTTTPQTAGAAYNLTVTGVRDRSANGNPIAAGTAVPFTAYAPPAILANVPEAANYNLIYQLPLPAAVPVWNTNAVGYTINEAVFGEQGFDRVAYLMELNGNWVYTSFDAFTNTITKIGVPTLRSSATAFQQNVTNLNVASNVASIVAGQGITTGNIEFWGGNYTTANGLNVPGASASVFDFGDTMTAGGHGSMQVHNYGASQTLFAFNNWGSNTTGNSEMGIGNNPNAAQAPDWTSTGNAGTYTTRNLYVLARPAPLVPSGAAPQVYQHPTSRLVNAGASTSFSVGATGPSPLSYQWRRNGQPIVGATNQWLDLSTVSAANAGAYDVVITTAGGMTTTSLAATLSVNALPTFAGYRFVARLNTPATLSFATLLAKAGDLDSDPLTITGATAPASGAVQVGATSLTYTPGAGFTGTDSFTVGIADGRGGFINGLVQVTVTSLVGNPVFDAKIAKRADGKVEALFPGTPGQEYVIERTTDLPNPAAWVVIATVTAGDDGLIPLLDATPPASKAFYRARPATP